MNANHPTSCAEVESRWWRGWDRSLWRLRILPVVVAVISASGAVAGQFGIFTYEERAAEIEITAVAMHAPGPVVVPAEIAGKPVTTISGDAFRSHDLLTHLSLPATVVHVPWESFGKCSLLTGFTVDVGNPAFKSVDGVVFDLAGETLLRFPSGRAGTYSVPAGTLAIAAAAFQDAQQVEGVSLPAGLLTIGTQAFESCFALIAADLPDGLLDLGGAAFSECHALQSTALPASLESIGASTFAACRSLQSVGLPPGLNGLSQDMFNGCWSLASISLPGSITIIPDRAFHDCPSLQGIFLPSGITTIGIGAFSQCHALTSLVLPDDLLNIDDEAFSNCQGLQTVVFPDGLTRIGARAFEYCPSLQSAILPESVEEIGMGAFRQCGNLMSVHLPPVLLEISDSLFAGCSLLDGVTLPSTIERIGQGSFELSGITALEIPEGTLSIGESAFNDCHFLSSLTIPDTVTEIHPAAFRSCFALEDLQIPDSVIRIGDWAFAFCTGLTTMTIPANVQSLGEWMFYGCGSLLSIEVDETNTSYADLDGVLYDISLTTLLQFPPGRGTPPPVARRIPRGGDPTPPPGGLVYAIPSSVQSIAPGAFAGSRFLDGISLPSSVMEIGEQAFADCNRLNAISVEAGNPVYGIVAGLLVETNTGTVVRAEAGKQGIQVLPHGIMAVGPAAFSGSPALEGIVFPPTVAHIGKHAFASCPLLSRAYFLGNSPAMGLEAFRDCATEFTIHFFEGSPSFSSPIWQGYPTLAIGTATPITLWLLANGYAHDTDLSEDTDGDGLGLLLEFAGERNPRHAESEALLDLYATESGLGCRYYAGNPGVLYRIETSGDLVHWTTEGIEISEPDPSNVRTAHVPLSGGRVFFRLAVDLAP